MTLEQVRYRPAYDRAPVTHYLYFLADPRTPRVARYIGVTKDPVQRARSHAKSRIGNAEFRAWKQELRDAGLNPSLFIVRTLPTLAEAIAAEWRLMARWRRRGCGILSWVVARSDEDNCMAWAGARASLARTLRAA